MEMKNAGPTNVEQEQASVEAEKKWKDLHPIQNMHMYNVPAPYNQAYEKHSDDSVSRIFKYFYSGQVSFHFCNSLEFRLYQKRN